MVAFVANADTEFLARFPSSLLRELLISFIQTGFSIGFKKPA
jgi:hypothetical protein